MKRLPPLIYRLATPFRFLLAPAAPSPAHQTSEAWRSDIDGLRAVAVLAVIFYHAFPKKIQGGFVGVDVFFVISGYLISRIIMSALDKGSFTFLDFYTRRIRRIFPALFLVLAFTALIGYYYLLPPELMPLGLNMIGGAFFFSNFVSWSALGGYFKPDAELTPLLHLWSLGIEEQFYLLWPLLLVVRKKFALNLLTILCVLFCVSFYQNIHAVHKDASLAFYWPHTRFWELFAGALLAYCTLYQAFVQTRLASLREKFSVYEPTFNRLIIKAQKLAAHLMFAEPPLREPNPITPAQWRDMASIIGAVLLTFSILRIKSAYAFPGYWAVLPVAGSFILLATGPCAFINRTILSARIMVFVGTISYPLYLWHWPLLSFSKILITDHPSALWRITLLATAALLAWLITITLEKYIRFGGRKILKSSLAFGSICLTACFGYYAYTFHGADTRNLLAVQHPSPERVLNNYLYFGLGQKNIIEYITEHGCRYHVINHNSYKDFDCPQNYLEGQPKIFLVGDSFAGYLDHGLAPLIREKNLNYFLYSKFGCVPFLTEQLKFDNAECIATYQDFFATLTRYKPDIVFVFNWNYAYADPQPHIYKETRKFHELANGQYFNFLDRLPENIARMKSLGVRHIVFIGQPPAFGNRLEAVKTNLKEHKPLEPYLYIQENISREFEKFFTAQPFIKTITYLSLNDALCKADQCLFMVGPNFETDLLLGDDLHLTKNGADYVGKNIIMPVIDNILNQDKAAAIIPTK